MQPLACLDGQIQPVAETRVSVDDRGFLFGDAVYEVIRIYAGRCWAEEPHMRRLARSLESLEFPPVDLARLRQRMHQTIARGGVQEGTAYLHLTRGVAPRRHAFPTPAVNPTELIVIRPYDDTPTARLRQAGAAVISHPDLRWKRCDVKSTNLLGNVLANEAAHRAGAFEAVLVGADGYVTEATHSSLLWVQDGRLKATPEGPEILPGTTRGEILELAAREGIPFSPGRITLADLAATDEVLLAGTTIEVLPVVQIDGAPIGEGRPGAVAQRLQAALRREIDAFRRAAVPATA